MPTLARAFLTLPWHTLILPFSAPPIQPAPIPYSDERVKREKLEYRVWLNELFPTPVCPASDPQQELLQLVKASFPSFAERFAMYKRGLLDAKLGTIIDVRTRCVQQHSRIVAIACGCNGHIDWDLFHRVLRDPLAIPDLKGLTCFLQKDGTLEAQYNIIFTPELQLA